MKKLETEIVVISAGTAGLPAAVTAAEGGAKVIVFEKMGHTGGTANRGNMLFALESRFQKSLPSHLSVEEGFKIHMDWTHWCVDARLVSAFFNQSASTVDWLVEEGVEFFDMSHGFGYNTAHVVKGEPPGPRQVGQAAAAMKILTRKAKALGIQMYLKTAVTKIIKKGGKIVGVTAQNRETGEEYIVKAKAVIVAAGGISNSPEMVKEYTGYNDDKDLFAFKLSSVTGDGVRMAWEVGAMHTPIYQQLMHHLPPPCHGPGGTAVEFSLLAQPHLMVNLMGERFVPEDLRGAHPLMGSAISLQKGKCGIMIMDGSIKKYYDEHPMQNLGGDAAAYQTHKHANLDDNIREAQSEGYKHLFMTDTLEELCEQTGINYDGLQKTIAEYNQICALGRDDVFHKDPKYLRPIKQPKYYAARFYPGSYGTSGGIKVNYKMEVLNTEFEVIPGLYAAGNDANNCYLQSYTPLAGNNIGFAVNSGRMAAESAMAYIKTIK